MAAITTGTYTGNGAENRQITVGFQCKTVILFNGGDLFWLCFTTTEAMKLDAGANPTMVDNLILHATDGFEVESWANENGVGFYYLAVG